MIHRFHFLINIQTSCSFSKETIMLCWKSTVHHCREEEKVHSNDIQSKNNEETSTSFTVWRKSLVLNCNGFTVIGADGSLVYRVDNYKKHPGEIVLMDGAGNPVFTICRPKKRYLSLVKNYWLIYEGEAEKHTLNSYKKPIFCVRKKGKNIMKRKANVLAYVYDTTLSSSKTYTVEGSYVHRSCKILDESRRVVGEIMKKVLNLKHMVQSISQRNYNKA